MSSTTTNKGLDAVSTAIPGGEADRNKMYFEQYRGTFLIKMAGLRVKGKSKKNEQLQVVEKMA